VQAVAQPAKRAGQEMSEHNQHGFIFEVANIGQTMHGLSERSPFLKTSMAFFRSHVRAMNP
jgi:hypothetical protein